MDSISKLANEVTDDVVKQDNINVKTIDPATIAIIIQVIYLIISYLLKKYNTSNGIKKARLNLIQRFLLKSYLKNTLRTNKGYKFYDMHENSIITSSLDRISKADISVIEDIVKGTI